jgi:hypothetical protein
MNSSPHGAYFTPEDEILPQETVMSEKLILTLPSPSEDSGSEDHLLQSWLQWGTFKIPLDANQGRRWTEMMIRLIRSLLLITKVMTLRGMCPDPSTGPHPIVATFLLALAIGDTVLDHHCDWDVPLRRRRSKRGISRSEDNGGHVVRLLSRFGSRIWITVGLTVLHFALISLSSSSSGEGFLREMAMLWRGVCCVPLNRAV